MLAHFSCLPFVCFIGNHPSMQMAWQYWKLLGGPTCNVLYYLAASSCVILNAVMSWLQLLAGAPPTSPLPTRAVFQYAPSRDSAVGQDICLQAGVLELSTVSVYINGTFTW